MRWVFLVNVGRLILKARELGIPFIIFTFHRSPEEQLVEFNAGRSRTKDGLHIKWLAIDGALWDDMNKDGTVNKDEIRWSFDLRYTTLGQYWESLGGVWGGRWKDPCDPYHFEWSDQMQP
jgi:hypothetical protein